MLFQAVQTISNLMHLIRKVSFYFSAQNWRPSKSNPLHTTNSSLCQTWSQHQLGLSGDHFEHLTGRQVVPHVREIGQKLYPRLCSISFEVRQCRKLWDVPSCQWQQFATPQIRVRWYGSIRIETSPSWRHTGRCWSVHLSHIQSWGKWFCLVHTECNELVGIFNATQTT